MSNDDRADRWYWLEPNVHWSEEPDLIAIELQQEDAGYELLTLIHKDSVILEETTFPSLGPSSALAGKLLHVQGVYRSESTDLPLIVVRVDGSLSKSIRDSDDDTRTALKNQVSKVVHEYQEKWREHLKKLREWEEEREREEDSLEQQKKSLEQLPDEEREREHEIFKSRMRAHLLMSMWKPDPPTKPRFNDDKKLLEMLSPAEWVSPLIEGEEAQQVQETVGGPSSSGSRDGDYEAFRMKGVDGEPGLLVLSWTAPQDRVASFPQLKAALEAALPSAFREPRLATVSPPKSKRLLTLDDTTFAFLDDIEPLAEESLFRMLDVMGREGMREEAEKARVAIEDTGTEALGFYQPFHIWDEEHWGIYLHLDRLIALASEMTLQPARALPLLINLVVRHELFHAKTEAAATWLELSASKKKYLKYQDDVYSKARGKAFWREEALANWEAMQWLKENCKDSSEIRPFEALFEMSPPGYRNWEDGDDTWTWRAFSTELLEGVPFESDGRRPLPFEGLLSQTPGFQFLPEDIPIRWVGKGSHADHLFRVPSRREMIKFFKSRGYELEHGGKHPKMCHKGTGKCFPVPLRSPVSRHVFDEFLKHFALDKAEYRKLRLAL